VASGSNWSSKRALPWPATASTPSFRRVEPCQVVTLRAAAIEHDQVRAASQGNRELPHQCPAYPRSPANWRRADQPSRSGIAASGLPFRQICLAGLGRRQKRSPLSVSQMQLVRRYFGGVAQPDLVVIYQPLQAVPGVAKAALAPAGRLFTVGQRGSYHLPSLGWLRRCLQRITTRAYVASFSKDDFPKTLIESTVT
jgi:hypothetical protein